MTTTGVLFISLLFSGNIWNSIEFRHNCRSHKFVCSYRLYVYPHAFILIVNFSSGAFAIACARENVIGILLLLLCVPYFIRHYFTLHLYRLSNFTCIGVTFLHTLFLYFTCKIMKKSWFQFISCCWTRKKRIFRQDCSTIFAQHA